MRRYLRFRNREEGQVIIEGWRTAAHLGYECEGCGGWPGRALAPRNFSSGSERAIRIIREYCVMNAYADTICDKRRDNREPADAANVTW